MNYTDTGLGAEQIAELKKSLRKTGWRVKIMKPRGVKLFDPAAAVTTKIDTNGAGSHYPLDTRGDKYIKIVHDPRRDRTFVLHANPLNTTTLAVVSVINHDRETSDPRYIETVNAAASAGWPVEYSSQTARDMDYNPDSDELALALPGTTHEGVFYGPALLVINCKRNIPELETNYCNRLKDNPAYLSCYILRAPDGLQNTGGQAFVKFVRYHAGRWWTWTRVRREGAIPGPGEFQICWQLGYFDAQSGAYALCFQNGWSPAANELRPDGGPWDPSVCYPAQPRLHPVYAGQSPQTGTTDGYIGDPSNGLLNVTAFEIVREGGGQILIATSPDPFNAGFGMEPFVYRISIPLMLNELTPSSRIIETDSIVIQAVYAPGTGLYYIPSGFAEKILTSLRGKTGGGLISVRADAAAAGAAHLYVESDYGTTGASFAGLGAGQSAPYAAHASLFIGDADAVTAKSSHINLGGFSQSPFSVTISFSVYKAMPGLVEIIGVHSAPSLARPDDSDRPATVTGTFTTPVTYPVKCARRAYPVGLYNCINNVFYSVPYSKFVMTMHDDSFGAGRGLYVYTHRYAPPETRRLNIYDASSGLAHDYAGCIGVISAGALAVGTNSSMPPQHYGDAVKVQFFDIFAETFVGEAFEASLEWPGAGVCGVFFDARNMRLGFATEKGMGTGVGGEIWLYTPPPSDGAWRWSRDIRVWWDGSAPDLTMGDGSRPTDTLGQPAAFYDPVWRQTKGKSSYEFSFAVRGAAYLPWAESPFNESADFPGVYDGALQDAARLIVERGVWDGREWSWIQEGQTFVVMSPAGAREGAASLRVTAMGPISLLVTRATYTGFHKPDIDIYTDAPLESDDGLTYYYAPGGVRVRDWALRPEPIVRIDGRTAQGYAINSTLGTITFPEPPAECAVTASFSAYSPGSNEAEDVIRCILTYPQELGGCGLDESYITRRLGNVTLTTTDHLTYKFPKSNLRPLDPFNKIYRDGVRVTGGFEWDERAGTVTFDASQAGREITGDAVYYTIQTSGATLRPLNLSPREQKSAYDAVQEVCRRVAPNYIFREGRDGKLECDFFSQKPAGKEDLAIADSDLIITSLSSNPIYEGLATRVLSLGQAELDELPDLALGKPVTSVWPFAWHGGVDVQRITDGDPRTGATAGYGRWDEGTYDVQAALVASGVTGIPCVVIDLEDRREVETIIVARPSQISTEGDAGAVQSMSIWASDDGSDFIRIVNPFELGPGQNIRFEAGTNFDEGLRFRYLRINIHSLGLYTWEGHTDSQMGISEVQCFGNKIIIGEAMLQADDPDEPLYDRSGLLAKYGVITHVARGGAPDKMLFTKELADLDARYTLEEIVRLLDKVEVRSPWLPGIPVFSTIRVANAVLGIDKTFFVENREAGPNGDTYSGTTLP